MGNAFDCLVDRLQTDGGHGGDLRKRARVMSQTKRRELWTKVHRYLGLITIPFLAFAAATGAILAYADPIDRLLNAYLFTASTPVQPGPTPLLVDQFQRTHAAFRVTAFQVNLPRGRNVPITGFDLTDPARALKQVFVDPATGRIIGQRSLGPALTRGGFVEAVRVAHFTLCAGTIGRWWMGIIAVVWLVTIPVGVYLTIPRKAPRLQKWKRSWIVKLASALPRLMLDLHTASGLWLLPVYAVLALTSVCLNFNDELFEPVIERAFPPVRQAQAAPGHGRIDDFESALRLGVRKAAGEDLRWHPALLTYDAQRDVYGVAFTDDGSPNYRALGPVKLFFHADDGRDAGRADPYHDGAALWLERALYPLHSGQFGGQAAILAVFLAGLCTFELCVTGGYVWLKKHRSRVSSRNARRPLAGSQTGDTER